MIGSWSDRSHSRWGKRLPFMVVGLPIICVASIALFATPLTGNTLPAISVALMLNRAPARRDLAVRSPYSGALQPN
ncbi:MFS transporter [Sphingomonas aerolata]|uniref:MFS transporter n=1 Tax=Sphingomonas aerolata TaxID=185951 RepID=UPI003A5C718B